MKNQVLLIILGLVNFVYATTIEDRFELLKKDPSLWPGHLEAFGSKQKKVNVEELYEWPSPNEFFTKYVDNNRPVLLKKVVLDSLAYKLFDDEYLASFPGSNSVKIYAEPEKKENRTKRGHFMSFQDFIGRYHSENLYMVNSLPHELRKVVKMPPPLRCEETKQLMVSQVTWFSSGGTKSVIHNDDVDNINCLYRGSKKLIFVDYNKFKKFVRIDHPEGGYSSIDVDKVDYVKFPELRHVEEFIEATMEEGDCLFIPYHWYHQVNSQANEKGQNLAINVWFKHVNLHKPKDCNLKEEDSTLDKYFFPDDDFDDGEEKEQIDEENDNDANQSSSYPNLEHFEQYMQFQKKPIKLNNFLKIIVKDKTINRDLTKVTKNQDDLKQIGKEIFNQLDYDADKYLSEDDFESFLTLPDEQLKIIEHSLSQNVAKLEDYFEDIAEIVFQESRKEKQLKDERATDEL